MAYSTTIPDDHKPHRECYLKAIALGHPQSDLAEHLKLTDLLQGHHDGQDGHQARARGWGAKLLLEVAGERWIANL